MTDHAEVTITIPAQLLEPGRQYTFTVSRRLPEAEQPLPPNSTGPQEREA